jgi:hypothetical protein
MAALLEGVRMQTQENPSWSWFALASDALRANWLLAVCLSAALLVPCFWTTHIQAGDLASHLYNAWLAQLIEQGNAPGLWLAHPWTNVLFDYLLAFLFRTMGPWAAEHIAVALSVLLFFWGEVALVWTLNRRLPRSLIPCLAMLAYGYVFHAGFFNYYISLGIALYLMAIVWHGHRGDWIGVALGFFVASLAHPIPVLCVLVSTIYIYLARGIAKRFQWVLFLAAIGSVVTLRELLMLRFTSIWRPNQFLEMTGADQVVVFGRTGWLLALALLVVWCLMIFRANPEWPRTLRGIPAQLFYICAAIIAILPDDILIAPERYGWFSAGPPRMSLLAAVLACALVGSSKPQRWHAVTMSGLAGLFFLALYANHRELNRLESEVTKLVEALPVGQRVVSYFPWQEAGERDPHFVYRLETAFERAVARLPFGGRFLDAVLRKRMRWTAWHLIDRACIGRCFSYGNYEPYSGEFRLRASSGNPITISNGRVAREMESGRYRVQARDLPLYLVYRCRAETADLCLRPMGAGEALDSKPMPDRLD